MTRRTVPFLMSTLFAVPALGAEQALPTTEPPLVPLPLEQYDNDKLSGGPSKDGIPSIDDPQFWSVDRAEAFLEDEDRVIGVYRNGKARGVLVAVNVHGAIMLYKAPHACGISQASSASSAVPALLAGSACCAPSLLLVLGIPALGAFAGLFGYLIPLSAAALIGSRIWQRRRGAPAMWAPITGATR